MVFVQLADHSGQGGNWWSNAVIGSAAHAAGAKVSFLVPPNPEPLLPGHLNAEVSPELTWRRVPRYNMQISYLRNEQSVRAASAKADATVLSLVQFGIARHPRLVQYLHNPVARPAAGSPTLGRLMQWNSTRRSMNIACHAPEFRVTADGLQWPHPIAPATLGLRRDVGRIGVRGRRTALAFGRAGHDENLEIVRAWLAGLTPHEARRIALVVSRSTWSERGKAAMEGIESLGVASQVLPRLEVAELDGVVEAADAVLVPYDSHQDSVSGVAIIAAAAGVPIIAGQSLRQDLTWPALPPLERGRDGLRKMLGDEPTHGPGFNLDGLAEWGERWVQLLDQKFAPVGAE